MSRIVLTNGVFDLLHPGHYDLLVRCRMIAGRTGKVIVAIDSDNKVSQDKGKNRPIYSFTERKKFIESLEYPIDSISMKMVDKVETFDTNRELYDLIKQVNPDIIIKGSDWKNNVIGSDLAEVIYVDKKLSISVTEIESRMLRNK